MRNNLLFLKTLTNQDQDLEKYISLYINKSLFSDKAPLIKKKPIVARFLRYSDVIVFHSRTLNSRTRVVDTQVFQ